MFDIGVFAYLRALFLLTITKSWGKRALSDRILRPHYPISSGGVSGSKFLAVNR